MPEKRSREEDETNLLYLISVYEKDDDKLKNKEAKIEREPTVLGNENNRLPSF